METYIHEQHKQRLIYEHLYTKRAPIQCYSKVFAIFAIV